MVELPHEGRSFSRKLIPMASRSGSASRELCQSAFIAPRVEIAIRSNGLGWQDTPSEAPTGLRYEGIQVTRGVEWNSRDGLVDAAKRMTSLEHEPMRPPADWRDFVLVALRETGSREESREGSKRNEGTRAVQACAALRELGNG